MKNSFITISLFFLAIYTQVFSQNFDLYAVSFNSPIKFGKVDLQTASLNALDSLAHPAPQFTSSYSSVFDQANKSYLFLSGESISSNHQYNFNRIDVMTGATLSTTVTDSRDRIYGLQYDMRRRKIYGLRYDSATAKVYISSINHQTGKVISERHIQGVAEFIYTSNHAQTAFDPERGIFFFTGRNTMNYRRLFMVKAATGQVIDDFTTSIASPIWELQYDIKSDILYALHLDWNNGRIELVEIDTSTGIYSHLRYLSDDRSGITLGTSCYDQESQTFVFLQSPVGSGLNDLTIYNTITDSLRTIVTNNGLRELEIDNSAFATAHFGLHPTALQPLQTVNVRIYPNPTVDELRIETAQVPEKINSIWLFDMTGKEVLSKGNLTSESYALDVSALPTGIYYLKLLLGDQVVQRKISII